MTQDQHWDYSDDNGPDHWAKHWPDCGGSSQSPIDLPSNPSHVSGRRPPQLEYGEADLMAVNNGHTIRYAVSSDSVLIWNDVRYALREFHFHAQSEHTIDGSHYPMEMHIVHQSDAGKYAVLGLFIVGGGPDDDTNLWSTDGELDWFAATDLPVADGSGVTPRIDLNRWFSYLQGNEMMHYHGSLTTPPCTETVDWFVRGSRLLTVPDHALEVFQAIYPNNFRPVQPIGNRRVELLKP